MRDDHAASLPSFFVIFVQYWHNSLTNEMKARITHNYYFYLFYVFFIFNLCCEALLSAGWGTALQDLMMMMMMMTNLLTSVKLLCCKSGLFFGTQYTCCFFVSPACPTGWQSYSGYCYYASDEKEKQPDARTACQGMFPGRSDLASISDQAEWEFVRDQVSKYRLSLSTYTLSVLRMYLITLLKLKLNWCWNWCEDKFVETGTIPITKSGRDNKA